MKRTAAVLIAIVIPVAAALAVNMPAEPAQVTNYGKKAPVLFDHAKHVGPELDCAACHHNSGEEHYQCGSCHKLEAQGDAPAIKEAMHGKDKGVCYACHLQKGAEHKKKCAECHVK